MKLLGILINCFCVATVVAELFGLGLLWFRGNLNSQRLEEIRVVLTGDEDPGVSIQDDPDVPQVSLEEVVNARARLMAELNAKDAEIAVFKSMTQEGAERLRQERAAFERQKQEFDEQLKSLQEKVRAEATEQARGILLALPPRDAVEQIMRIPVPEAVVLMKGMPEKSIARILKEFKSTEEQVERGREIFEALAQGEPEQSALRAQQNSTADAAAPVGGSPR